MLRSLTAGDLSEIGIAAVGYRRRLLDAIVSLPSLAVTVTTRNVAAYRDPAVILIDQLKEIYIDRTLNAIDMTHWYPTVMRKEYALAFTVTETGLDDPDQMFYENYFCGSEGN